MKYKMRITTILKGILFLLLAHLPWLAHAQTGGHITLKRILDGAKGQLAADSVVTVSDSIYFNTALAAKLDTPYQVRNIITFSINEYATLPMQDSFHATANLRIYYTLADLSVDSVDQQLTINYDTAGTYAMRRSFVFNGAHRVKVRVLGITSTAPGDILPALLVLNEMEVHPVYKLSCKGDAVKFVYSNAATAAAANELEVNWPVMTGADVYDLEWAYVEQSALSIGRYGNPSNPDPALIFENNTTRVTLAGNNYSIPLLYNDAGTLYYRVRGVQEKAGYQRMETAWSSDTITGLGAYPFSGHEPTLNWQSTISFAEDGKRKVVVQYYDGSLRGRQTVTKDNSTNTVVAAETLYDYQGRPAIQVLPAPTLNTVLKYAHNLNSALNGAEYDKAYYDTLPDPESYLTASAAPMSTSSGTNQYYSPNNPEKNIGYNQFIPDGEGYAFTETEYTADNTGRVLRQSGVGPTFRLGSGHETKYAYNTAAKEDLYALFGTEVGDNTHYFKNTVTDGNGQTSVSYVDMHGRTIATALAGSPENRGLEDLPSKDSLVVTDSLSGPEQNTITDMKISSRESKFVAESGYFTFTYQLTPPVLQKPDCNGRPVCYTGLYDLEIRITDDAFNQRFDNRQPFERTIRAKLDSINVSCNQPAKPIIDSFTVYLKKGSYEFSKTLTINKAAMDYYRDSIFLKSNVCNSYESVLEEQKARIRTIQCIPDCAGCLANLGDWEPYRTRYMSENNYPVADTASYRLEALAAYNNALDACTILCGTGTETDAIRDAMLLDMAAPSGQYAIPTDTANIHSIFYLNLKDTSYTYMDTSIHYLDEAGREDKVYDEGSGLFVRPQDLRPAQFAAAFKSSWASALLHLHPEYCKLVEKNKYRSSEQWNIDFESVDTYAEARSKGYLNPTNMSGVPFPVSAVDPLATNFKAALESRLQNSNGSGYTMWSVAASSVKCTSIDKTCTDLYKTPALAFDQAGMCEGDRNMAWRSFRNMYLTAKRTVIDDYLKGINCGAKAEDLLAAGQQLRFTSSNEQLANAGYGSIIGAPDEIKMRDSATVKERRIYDENCRAYVSYWAEQLAGCYSASVINNELIPKLIEVCKAGSDTDHPFGSSSVKPGSTYPYRSFEEVIDDYNRQHNIPKSLACNADVITMPKPYDRQVSYGDQPSFSRPTDCQCDKLAELRREYTSLKQSSETFSSYLSRKRGVKISQSDLDMLESACSSPANSSCSWLPAQITIPALLQCTVAPACATCDDVNRLYSSFVTTYGITPQIVTAGEEDSLQEKKNDFFAAYMNNRLGFGKQAWEYLAFLNDSCKKTTGAGITVCKPAKAGTNAQVATYTNGKDDDIKDIVRSRDGGYLLAGWTKGCSAGQEDAYVIKTDAKGAFLWAKTYGAENSEEFRRIRLTTDGGYIAIGSTNSYCYDEGAIMVVKLDSLGSVEWNKAIEMGRSNYQGKGYDIIQTSEGEYAFAGMSISQGNPLEWVTGVLTNDGSLKWSKIIASPENKETISLLENSDTLVIATSMRAVQTGANYDAVILKQHKSTGAILNVSGYGISGTDHIPGAIMKTSSGYKLMADRAGILVDITAGGSVLSARKIDLPGTNEAGLFSGIAAADGSILAAQTVPAGASSRDVYLHKIGTNNGILWSSHVRVDGADYVRRLVENPDGSFAGAGILNNKALLMIATTGGKTGCKDSSENIKTSDIYASLVRKTIASQTITDLNQKFISAVALAEKSCVPIKSLAGCPGLDSCYVVNDLPLLCGNLGVFPIVDIDETTACSDSTFFAESAARVIHKVYTDSVSNDFDAAYLRTALKAASLEKFAVRYSLSEYHYTLYYYDQAGNLVKTVPPAGVVKNRRQTWIDSVEVAKAAGVKLVPAHKMTTEYRYNTLNGVVAQKTPDAGISRFWYDRLGRLAVSQSAKQVISNHYSYTSYDDLGRITEVGQLLSASALNDAISRNQTNFSNWFNSVSNSRTEITKTTYDNAYPFFNGKDFVARNLRNRVSWTGVYRNADAVNAGEHSTASFYSYDVLGNVDTLLQDYNEGKMAAAGHRFKRIAYNYDLISGKVNEVAYQPGAPDAFYHRYNYDADNRLTGVETSNDRVYWENDAFYQYYKHGPLARTVIGQQQVQGVDYAYTLQGWLKGVNSTALTAESDQGRDGKVGSVIPVDAFGFALHYNGADYKPINGANHPFAAAAGDFKPLYNGNIGAISQQIAGLGNPLLYNYSYDVLNRIKGMQAYNGLSISNNTWDPVTLDDFIESVNYDPNGNILKYNRNGNKTFAGKPLGMDSLTYAYRPGTNKLDHVHDAVGVANYDNDLDDQLPANYVYDSIGNLVKDVAGGIDNINWTLYGKISDIVKANNGGVIRYTYDAGGNRISKNVHDTVTWYVRDATGNVMSVYTLAGDDNIRLSESHLYGSSRLGVMKPELQLNIATESRITLPGLGLAEITGFTRGKKAFELTNHLQNVLATVSDKKVLTGEGTNLRYNFNLLSANEYYPFGMQMPGRAYSGDGYRYGFNGKENDNEVKGEGNQQDYGFRIYDPRLGKFLSVDPLTKEYPELTPYQFASNTPIQAVDLDGAEAFFVHGTESSAKRWTESNMAKRGVQTLLRLTNNRYYNVGFNWGSIVYNDYGIRAEAAKQLATYVLKNRVKGEEITLIGHSHGGNVAIQAAKIIYEGTGIKVNIISIGTPAYNKKGGVENPETNKKYINDHIALWNTIDGVSGGMAGDDNFKTSSITTNVEIDVSKYFNSGETVDAHSFDVLAPESLENAIDAGKVRKVKPAELKVNVEVMNPEGSKTNLPVKLDKKQQKK
jgi:RHS repeat-associated protein